jgi:hypothetical protein
LLSVELSWRREGSGLWRAYDLRRRLVAEVVRYRDGWMAAVWDDSLLPRFASAEEAKLAVQWAVSPRAAEPDRPSA